jgi:hypothetical protein
MAAVSTCSPSASFPETVAALCAGLAAARPTTRAERHVPRIKLQVITDTSAHPVLAKPPGGHDRLAPFMTGHIGDTDLLCGRCEHLLADRIVAIAGLVFVCPVCGANNLT